MKLFLDSDYRCHLTGDGAMREIDTDMFDRKCRVFIEGYRFVPEGESWTREDGTVFHGEMAAPAVDYDGLAKAQEQYELDLELTADMQSALAILGVTE